jgi:two-component system OmpR family sensor kinase
MARHFLQLYLLIVITLAAVSWGQGRLWDIYSGPEEGVAADNQSQVAMLKLVDEQLRAVPREQRAEFIADLAKRTGVDLELFEPQDIAGSDTHQRLERGDVAHLHAGDKDWLLRRVSDEKRVLVFRFGSSVAERALLDWALAFIFYAAIALVIMTWLWPLTRDLRQLERSTTTFGDRNWRFGAQIGLRSPVYSLAEAFRRMAARIDSLIGAQKDMTNAMSHEMRTPLARMRFEIEMARMAKDPETLARYLNSLNVEVGELDAFITATLDYAILERAEVALNVRQNDLTLILPGIVETLSASSRQDLRVRCEVSPNAGAVRCDALLMETVVRNLLYNAVRYARSEVHVIFFIRPDGVYNLRVDDDGPGIPEADHVRVFDSFVQLDDPGRRKSGYGLGLAIVKRIVEWHGGKVAITRAGLGGAGFSVTWGPTVAG